MRLTLKSNLLIKRITISFAIAGLSASVYVIAAEEGIMAVSQEVDQLQVDQTLGQSGLDRTIELNFSPEKREMLRKALDEYARSVHEDHEQIAARRRKMQDSIKARFFDADIDFDDTIDRQEATNKLPQIARHFKSVDLNSDELISLDELLAAQERMLARRQSAQYSIEMRKMINGAKVKAKSNQAAYDADKPAL